MKFKRIHYLTRGQLYSDFVRWYTRGVRTCEPTGGIVMENIDSATRNAIRYTLCDLEWHARYCSAMADRCHGLHKAVRFAILAGVAFEGIVLYGATINPWLFSLGIAGGLVLACLTIWDATSDYATNAATFRMVTIICQRLRNEADVLWRDVEGEASDRRPGREYPPLHQRAMGCRYPIHSVENEQQTEHQSNQSRR